MVLRPFVVQQLQQKLVRPVDALMHPFNLSQVPDTRNSEDPLPMPHDNDPNHDTTSRENNNDGPQAVHCTTKQNKTPRENNNGGPQTVRCTTTTKQNKTSRETPGPFVVQQQQNKTKHYARTTMMTPGPFIVQQNKTKHHARTTVMVPRPFIVQQQQNKPLRETNNDGPRAVCCTATTKQNLVQPADAPRAKYQTLLT